MALHPAPQRCLAAADAALAAQAPLPRRPAGGASRGGRRRAGPPALRRVAPAAARGLHGVGAAAGRSRDLGRAARPRRGRPRIHLRRAGRGGASRRRRAAHLHVGHHGTAQGRAAHAASGGDPGRALPPHAAVRPRRARLHHVPVLLDRGHRHVDRRLPAAAGDVRSRAGARHARGRARQRRPRLAAPAQGDGRACVGGPPRPVGAAQARFHLSPRRARRDREGRVRRWRLLRSTR